MGGSYDFQPYIGISSSPTGDNAFMPIALENMVEKYANNLINTELGIHTQLRGLRLVEGGGSGGSSHGH